MLITAPQQHTFRELRGLDVAVKVTAMVVGTTSNIAWQEVTD